MCAGAKLNQTRLIIGARVVWVILFVRRPAGCVMIVVVQRLITGVGPVGLRFGQIQSNQLRILATVSILCIDNFCSV